MNASSARLVLITLCAFTRLRFRAARLGSRLDAFELVVRLRVQLFQFRERLLVRVPHPPSRRLQHPPQHVPKRLRVRLSKLLAHRLVAHVPLVGAVEDPVLREPARGAPAHERGHPLRYLVRAAGALVRHRVRPARVQKLRSVLEPERLLEVARGDVLAEGFDDGARHLLPRKPLPTVRVRRLLRKALFRGVRRRDERAGVRVVLLNVRQAVLHAVDLLDDAFRRPQKRLEHLRSRGALLVAFSVRERVPRRPRVSQLSPVLPLARADALVHHRAVIPRGVAEQTRARVFHPVASHLRRVLLDEILFRALLRRVRRALEQVVQQRDDVRERVAEDARHVTQHVHARPPSGHLRERDELVAHDSSGALFHDARADEREDDGDRLPLRLDRVEPPKVHGHRLRERAVVRRRVLLEDRGRDARAAVRRRGRRHPVRVERVDVTSGG
mmetsp:Transcript_6901/g.25386  ORF Transcript_6901/g.25386 Transcript_6901/m.25386 type:complete len:443 (-) Transcript_6901:2937-4265(-)